MVLVLCLYHFNFDENFIESLFNVIHDFGLTRSAQNERSDFLWNQRLGSISK